MKRFNVALVFLLTGLATVPLMTSCSDDEPDNPTPPACPDNTLCDDRDDAQYKTIALGGNTWIAENLNYNTNGSVDDSYFCYEDNTANCTSDGALYTFAAAKVACPTGWHLSTRAEWEDLIKAVTDETDLNIAVSSAGKALKINGSSGFNAILTGIKAGNGTYGAKGELGDFWALDTTDDAAFSIEVSQDSDGVSIREEKDDKISYCIRCVQDK